MRNTRGNQRYTATELWQQIDEMGLQTASVRSEGATVLLGDIGPAVATKTDTSDGGFGFWDYVIEGKHNDMSWLVRALQ